MSSIDDIVKGIFGKVRAFSRGYSSSHDGWDIPAPVGTPVYAVMAGTVSYAHDARTQTDRGAHGWAIGGGNVVNVNVGNQLHTQYAHLSSFVVREGQTIQKGQLIGYVGRTGGTRPNGTTGPGDQFVGPHLHFGVWDKKINKMVKPETVLNLSGGGSTGGGGDTAGSGDAFLALLKKLGISTDPAHVFTDQEALAIAKNGGYPSGMVDIIQSRYKGKSVQDILNTLGSGGTLGNNPGEGLIPDIPGALMALGNTATKLVAYIIATILIIVGLYLYSKSEEGGFFNLMEENADRAASAL